MMAHCGEIDSFDFLLFGRNGSDMSSTANTVLGRSVYPTLSNTGSNTITYQHDCGHFDGFDFKVVHIPGVGDDTKDDVQQFKDTIKLAIANNPKGYHAFLYVIKFGNQFTSLDQYHIFILKALWGTNFIKDHCILVMTYDESLEMDPALKSKALTFDEWLKGQDNKLLQNLLTECKYRAVLVNNGTDDPHKQEAQKRKIVYNIQMLPSPGKRYTNENFQQAENKRTELLLTFGEDQENIDIIDKIGTLIIKIKNATDDEVGLDMLLKVSHEIETLNGFVEKASKRNLTVKPPLSLMNNVPVAFQAKKSQVGKHTENMGLLKGNIANYEKELEEFLKLKSQRFTSQEILTPKQLVGERAKQMLVEEYSDELKTAKQEINTLEIKCLKSRRECQMKTNLRIEELESKYILEKNAQTNSVVLKLIDYITKLDSIKNLFETLTYFFNR